MSVSVTNLSPELALAEAIRLLGGYAATSRVVGLKTAWAVQKWSRCPPHHVLGIETAVKGAITRHQLRPDLYPAAATFQPTAEHGDNQPSVLSAFFLALSPADRVLFEQESAAASASGARGEEWIAAMHAIAVKRGASFSLEELLAEYHAGRWHAAAERAALTWLPAALRLRPGHREVRDRQFVKSQTKDLEPVPPGPGSIDTGAAA